MHLWRGFVGQDKHRVSSKRDSTDFELEHSVSLTQTWDTQELDPEVVLLEGSRLTTLRRRILQDTCVISHDCFSPKNFSFGGL